MSLILVCLLYSGYSGIILTIPNPPSDHYIRQECAVYPTLKEAAVAQYGASKPATVGYGANEEQHGPRYYRIDMENLTVTPIQAPTVRLEVDER